MKPGFALKAFRALSRGRPGDAAAYKSAVFRSQASPAVVKALDALDDPFPAIDIAALRSLPPMSFGAAYAAFLDACGLTPFNLSPDTAAEVRPHATLEIRYVLLHDAFHVLLDYDTSLAGEGAVWSFVAAQAYSPQHRAAAAAARALYPLVRPSQRATIEAAWLEGRARGEAAPCLIAQPVERWWADPLTDVRERLSLGRATVARLSGDEGRPAG